MPQPIAIAWLIVHQSTLESSCQTVRKALERITLKDHVPAVSKHDMVITIRHLKQKLSGEEITRTGDIEEVGSTVLNRNAVLGRVTAPEELAFLRAGGFAG